MRLNVVPNLCIKKRTIIYRNVYLTQKILDDLFNIYKEVAGCTWDRNPRLKDVQKDMNTIGALNIVLVLDGQEILNLKLVVQEKSIFIQIVSLLIKKKKER